MSRTQRRKKEQLNNCNVPKCNPPKSNLEKPIKILTLDTETYNGLAGDLKRIAIYDGDKVTFGYTFLEIEQAILKYAKYYEVHIYIHNIEFDIRKMQEVFSPDRILWSKCFVINHKFATIATKNYILHDSFKILPMSLEMLSGEKGFNVEHGKVDLWKRVQEEYPNVYKDKVDFLDRCHVDDPIYLEYLGYDVISLYEILDILLKLSKIPIKDFVKRVSTASLSRYIFKNGYGDKKFYSNGREAYKVMTSFNYKNETIFESILRDAYFGGRTEVFKMKLEGHGYHYDINSLYPFNMLTKEFPVGKPLHQSGSSSLDRFNDYMSHHHGAGFIFASIYIPEQTIPPLPVGMGKLTFPCGYVNGTFTFYELDYAVKNCGVEIIEAYESLYYPCTEPIFKEFIELFSQLKIEAEKTGNMALRYFAKLIMNTGYGYTGMKREKSAIIALDKYNPDKHHLLNYSYDLGFGEIEKIVNSDYIQVQVAAYVTSYSRITIYEGLKEAAENGNVYYCDTDSVVTDVPLSDKLVDKYELGKFKLEKEPTFAIFLKPKMYMEYDGELEVKYKGISKERQKSLTQYDYEFLYGVLKDFNVHQIKIEKAKIQFPSVTVALKKGRNPNDYRLQDKYFKVTHQDKRYMDYKNNETRPLYFNTEKEFENFSFDDMDGIINIRESIKEKDLPSLGV